MNYDYNNQYSNTSYGAQGGAGGGGFLDQKGSQSGSQASPGGSKTYGKDTLRPVTIKQLLEAQQPHPDAEFKIDGIEISQVTFVGQIRNVSSQATNSTYKLDDGTGAVEVKLWVDESVDNTETKLTLVEGVYARVWGKIRVFGGKQFVNAHVIRKIEDMNEVQYHLLEAAAVHCYFTKGPPEQFIKSEGAGDTAGLAGANVKTEMSEDRVLPPMSPNAKRIFTTLKASPQNNEGLHVQNLAAQLGMDVSEVMKAGDELLSQGLIFTTVDDDTWAVLEF